jgi:DNA-binding MarR family transcriptional regulator
MSPFPCHFGHPEVELVLLKKKSSGRTRPKARIMSDAERLAEIFPRMMTALSQITHAEELIHENLTPSQIKVLNILGVSDVPKRMSEIANELGITQASLTETAKKLAAQGYITRARKADDDRVVNVTLTPQGKDLAVEIKLKICSYFNLVCDGLDPKDRRRLVESHEFIFKTYMDAEIKKTPKGKAA